MITKAGELARQACIDFPHTATRALADMLNRMYPSVYMNLEHARDRVRYYRKQTGHKTVSTDSFVPFVAPPSDAKDKPAYNFDITGSGTIIADVHIPYHDKKATETTVNYAIQHNLTDFLILDGDIQDHYRLSNYCNDPRLRSFPSELDMMGGFLGDLNKVFKKIVFKVGNHEFRYIRYMQQKAPELLGIEAMDYASLLNLAEQGIDYVDYLQPIHVGESFTILHGHEHGNCYSPVNPARSLFMRTKACAAAAHNHQTSHHAEPTVRGKSISCWSIGCLCELKPDYMPFNKWNHGFAEFHYSGGDDWDFVNKRIVNGIVR